MVAVLDGREAAGAINGQDEACQAVDASLVVGRVGDTVGNFDFVEAQTIEPHIAGENGDAVTAIVVSSTTAGDDDASVLRNAPN